MSGQLTPEQWAQAGYLIRAGVPRQQVAIIYDVGVSTLYRKFPPSNMPLMPFMENNTPLISHKS
ncbi:helix-turn-helix domain-containing protein [Salmonella enterica]|nr:helix-turn-helix domain-containing protein [Salmonella enterica]EIB0505112.1 helix-turn-helix domain-containing protein [Salmonella enterica]EIB5282377.1 helix-turn-helix domain-containing protein [Salmonella enterica]EIE0510798.1 helix-turn-helix domain-containing protein [Salmonella enterica]EIE5913222.1 helix-turn-helix domain-containing protein [Salmonella enterica]